MLEARFEKPRGDWPRQINLSTLDYAYAMQICLKLSTLDVPSWDLQLVRRELDSDEFLDKQIQDVKNLLEMRNRALENKVDSAGARDQPLGLDHYERSYRKLSGIRARLRTELAATIPPEGTGATAQAGIEEPGTASAAGSVTDTGMMVLPSVPEDMMPSLDGSLWQEVCRMSEWEIDFCSLLGWGGDDTCKPL